MADEEKTESNDWLDAIEVPEAETEAEAIEPTQEVAAEDAETEPQGEVTDKVEADPKHVPLAALQGEREKRQAAERELADLRARAAQVQPQADPVRHKAPDAYEDPEGYDAYLQNQIAAAVWQERAERSGKEAERTHGKETVETAIAWAQAEGLKDPTLGQRVRSQSSPVEYVVEEYKRSQTLQALNGKSLDDYLLEQATAKGWIVSQPDADASIQKPSSPKPPKSLSQAPGNGGIGKAPKEADWTEVKFALG